jgi:hypothetical protein
MQKIQDREEDNKPGREVDLKLTILKNRNGRVNDEITFTFDRHVLLRRATYSLHLSQQTLLQIPYPIEKQCKLICDPINKIKEKA